MIIRNDNISEATIAETAFDPTTFANIAEFWRSDYGVATTGSVLDSWTGMVNGNVLNPQRTEKGSYNTTDSNFNGYPSIQSASPGNNAGYVSNVGGGTVNKTLMIVGRITTDYPTAVIAFMYTPAYSDFRVGQHETLAQLSSFSYGTPDGSPTFKPLTDAAGSNTNFFLMLSYNIPTATCEVYASNTSVLQKRYTYNNRYDGNNPYNPMSFNFVGFGGYSLAGSIQPYGNGAYFSCVEIVVINGTPTQQELVSYSSYLNKRYGI